MELPLSAAEAAELVVLPEIGSTNDELAARASAGSVPEFSVLVTANQTAGRGRLGRVWVAPPDTGIAISVLLRPVLPSGIPLDRSHFGWLPLIAGVAMARAVQSVVPVPAALKWPNDVQLAGLKVSGLLAELLPSGEAVVIGAGVNLSLQADELPTQTATSLAIAGATQTGDELADTVLSTYLRSLRELLAAFIFANADPVASGILASLTKLCTTLGRRVRVQLPSGDDLIGEATGIDATGRLLVRRSPDAPVEAVAAGDVTHLRYE
jgi:BirA family transcriptional regulator, biotin operon repressor / biotin---[acetyl-CoA-carboxylase] ligase